MAKRGDDPARQAAAAVDRVRRAYREAAASVEKVADDQQAFELASRLRDAIDDLVGDAAILRALMAERIFVREELSLAALAERISVSKSRANQFINMARTAREGSGEADV